ncbi:MAG TPA: S8 family serine peptidase [Pyrinomonadaceae bacterium]
MKNEENFFNGINRLTRSALLNRARYSGFLIIRLSPDVPFIYGDDLRKHREEVPNVAALLDEYPEIATRPLIRTVPPEEILAMEAISATSNFPPLHSLTSYWRLDTRELESRERRIRRPEFESSIEQRPKGPKSESSIEEIFKCLNDFPEVEFVYREKAAMDPSVDYSHETLSTNQHYLDPPPQGIDARWASQFAHGIGSGVGLVDVEQAWNFNHVDLIGKAPVLICNDNHGDTSSVLSDHGTAVLGEIVGAINERGIVGIAPGVTSVRVASHYEADTDSEGNVAEAIVTAIRLMDPGDVLLLEVTRNNLPTETDPADLDAIRLALGYKEIVVVEAAGNGEKNLDDWPDEETNIHRLSRTIPDFAKFDSGAIIVGACSVTLPLNRLTTSNFGSRVDCFAAGNRIFTAGGGDVDWCAPENERYTNSFGETSGAAAIIAGAALVLQGMCEAATSERLLGVEMRVVISDHATGIHQEPNDSENIGVMPNLRKIAEHYDFLPDVYLRDNLNDTGVVPSADPVSASPDIIVRPNRVANPAAAFGEGSGTENSSSLSRLVEVGQDNFVYVRMRNRSGRVAAPATTATVYWSEVATLVTPDLWHLIGTTSPINVPAGDTLVITEPLVWHSANIPAPGHYCFVGVLNQADDPAPPLAPTDWDGFVNFIHSQNNVSWRNFNVINEISDPSMQSFTICGAPDRTRRFHLEIIRRLPLSAEGEMEMPLDLFLQLPPGLSYVPVEDQEADMVRVKLPRRYQFRFSNVSLPRKARYRCRFLLQGLQPKDGWGHSIAIRQIYKEQEVGRVTWSFTKAEKD